MDGLLVAGLQLQCVAQEHASMIDAFNCMLTAALALVVINRIILATLVHSQFVFATMHEVAHKIFAAFV